MSRWSGWVKLTDEERREKARVRARQWHIANHERHLESMRQRRKTNPEKVNAAIDAAKAKKPEYYRALDTAYRKRNEARLQAQHHQYYLLHREEILQKVTRRRRLVRTTSEQNRTKNLKRRGVPLTQTAREWVTIIRLDPCSYCGELKPEIVIDHIVSIRRGGDSDWDNLTAACRPCNAAKHRLSLLAFLVRRYKEEAA